MSSSTVSASAATPMQQPLQRRLDEAKPSKTDINLVIMDYLISEGYPRAAEKFAREANIQIPVDEESIKARVEIRKAIHSGNIEAAIRKINDLYPQILDNDAALHFALLRLQLIGLICSCTSSDTSDITPALHFASSQLSMRAANNPTFLKDLENTMTLLIMLPSNTLQPHLAELLEPSLRRKVASQVNEAILTAGIGGRGEARLHSLVRLRHWAEKQLKDSSKDLPRGLTLDYLETGDSIEETNGHNENADIMVS